ncbi:MAG: NADH-quinone oxidoreductase subunit L [Alphaproteobacteria bacterium 32-64-14]|nr:MAG: NADH-quinone oxidoreductase subunit L [Alphaproteobacteria bacterium 32-64-14]
MTFQEVAAILIVLSPGIAAAVAGLGKRLLGDKGAMAVTTGIVVAAAALAAWQFFGWSLGGGAGEARTIVLSRWFDVDTFIADWAIRIDTLSVIMMFVVTSVSALVHIYSIGYMAEDPHRGRFFAYLSLFTFAMLMLVTADNFIQLFFGWEGVGLASYLLIGFWYKKPSANSAAIKAFVVNRVGDFGFALGIMALVFMIQPVAGVDYAAAGITEFSSIKFDTVFAVISQNLPVQVVGQAAASPIQDVTFDFLGVHVWGLEIAGILLFIGAMGKSAQFFLHTWLPDAMEGPTPVSALIHAATMVTAGVFLVCRASPLYAVADVASNMITVVGAVTCLFAATIGLAQNDIKRVVAYSTCSQLGYMFFAAGVGAYGAAMFHLFTHAFFKALLFLGAGSVIHGMHHEQDMRFMGGVRQPMMFTWAMMLIGTLALIGFGIPGTDIGFAGFFSKDAIIESAYASSDTFGPFAFWCSIAAALLTSFYSWRLMFMTFEGKYRPNPHAHHDDHSHAGDHAHDHSHDHAHAKPKGGRAPAHESPLVMLVPLLLLAVGAVFAGLLFKPSFLTSNADNFWQGAIVREADPLYGPCGIHPNGDAAHCPAGDHAPAAAHAAASAAEEAHGAAPAEEHAPPAGGEHHELPAWVVWAPFVVTMTGLFGAIIFYLLAPGVPRRMAQNGGPMHSFLSHKWYFDEIYNFIFVKGTAALGDLFWKVGDKKIIDGLGPDGVTGVAKAGAGGLSRLHTGYIFHYALVILVSAVIFVAFVLAGQGR